MLRLELLEDRVVYGTAAPRKARNDFLKHLRARIGLVGSRLPLPNHFGVKSRLRGLRRLAQRIFASNESTAFLSLPTNSGTAPWCRSNRRFVIAL